jgi:hypothetical protein
MAGYLGTKTVLLSTTAANVTGDATISGDLTVDTDTLYVDSTNNRVGIGTSSPSANLDVASSNATIHLTDTDDTTYAEIRNNGGTFTIASDEGAAAANSSINFKVDGSEAMRIDSSGNLLVGTAVYTGGSSTAQGGGFLSSGTVFGTRDNNEAAIFNRLTSDGDIVAFRKQGITVGSIDAKGGDLVIHSSASGHCGFRFSGTPSALPVNQIGDTTDNQMDLGNSGTRFDDVYATNGTIQTSDRNEKQDIASLTPTEMLVAARLSTGFKNFRWKDSVAEKGTAARVHSGAIAQDVQDAFTAEGLDAGDYSMFISATWWTHDVDVPAVEAVAEVVDEDGVVVTEAVEAVAAYTRTDTYDTEAEAPVGAVSKTRLGVRYPELLSFVAAYNEQRFASIEARLTALEAV